MSGKLKHRYENHKFIQLDTFSTQLVSLLCHKNPKRFSLLHFTQTYICWPTINKDLGQRFLCFGFLWLSIKDITQHCVFPQLFFFFLLFLDCCCYIFMTIHVDNFLIRYKRIYRDIYRDRFYCGSCVWVFNNFILISLRLQIDKHICYFSLLGVFMAFIITENMYEHIWCVCLC